MKITPEKITRDQQEYYQGVVIPIALEYFCKHPDKLLRLAMKALEDKTSSYWLTEQFIHEVFKIYFKMETTSLKGDKDKMTKFIDDVRELMWDFEIDVPPANQPPMEVYSND